MDLLGHDTGSAKRLNKKGCTSSRVSGPPRFSNNTPTLSSPIKGAADVFCGFEATNALRGRKYLLIDCLENMDCKSGHSEEYLETTWLLVGQASIWSLKARFILLEEPMTLEVGLCRGKEKQSFTAILNQFMWNHAVSSSSILTIQWCTKMIIKLL